MINVHTPYSAPLASERIDRILNEGKVPETPSFSIPKKSDIILSPMSSIVLSCLTVTFNIRSDSSDGEEPTKGTVAKILFSEIGRVMYDNSDCYDIGAFGNIIWGIFNAPLQNNLNTLLETAAKVESVVDLINSKLTDKHCRIVAGIGIDYGSSVYITDEISVVKDQRNEAWMGDVIENSSRVSLTMTFNNSIMVSNNNNEKRPIGITESVYKNLKQDYQAYFVKDDIYNCYRAGLINVSINDWIKDNIKNKLKQ